MVNAIKAKPLSCRLFTEICNELGSEHQSLLFHNGVRWLSRGKVLSRFHELLHEFFIFATENKDCSHFLEYLNDDEWNVKLAYLADIFGHLNELNLQIQGTGMNCFTFMNKIDAFKKKLAFWKTLAIAQNFETFPLVLERTSNNARLTKYIAKIIDQHLKAVIGQFNLYFSQNKDPRVNNLWIANPFVNISEPNDLTAKETAKLLGKICIIFFI